jgi:DNA polymerase I-like protein with 3'-5' exonuclease and polymerase domains
MTHERYNSPLEFDMALQAGPVMEMMKRGILVDHKEKHRLTSEYMGRWKQYQQHINIVAGRELNVNSPKQVREFLHKELNLPARKHKGKVSTAEPKLRALMADCSEKLETLSTESAKMRWMRGHTAIYLILKIRSIRKRLSSYLNVEVDGDNRMRTLLKVGGTETGRLSSSKTLWDTGCNLQTIPKELRTIFIADDGMELAEFDLNRGESWIYAHLSKDPELLRIHHGGLDFHAETAAAIAHAFSDRQESTDQIVKLFKAGDEWAYFIRYLGKRVNHASAYRMGPFMQAEVINNDADDTGITITVGQAKIAQQLWKQKYSGMPGWWSSIERTLSDNARTLVTPYGRKQTFYDWWGESLFKEATAYVPQSTSVDYLNLGMLDVFNDLVRKGAYGLELLHQNHDAILVQYKESCRAEVMGEIISRLERSLVINDVEFTIPVEGQYGHSWGKMTEWKG